MGGAPAVKIAIDLMHLPSRVRLVRSAPLPEGVLMLLQIAAGDRQAEIEAAELTGRPQEIVREAAAFFIEQILLGPGTDSYRRLGASPQATKSELRRNMALLLRWLHPDLDRQGVRSLFAGRVTGAWNDLKTPERRAAYDEAQRTLHVKKSLPRDPAVHRPPWESQPFKQRQNNAPYGRWGKPGRSLCTVEPMGSVPWVLLALLGGAKRWLSRFIR
jgi:hypothetical protein